MTGWFPCFCGKDPKEGFEPYYLPSSPALSVDSSAQKTEKVISGVAGFDREGEQGFTSTNKDQVEDLGKAGEDNWDNPGVSQETYQRLAGGSYDYGASFDDPASIELKKLKQKKLKQKNNAKMVVALMGIGIGIGLCALGCWLAPILPILIAAGIVFIGGLHFLFFLDLFLRRCNKG